MKTVLICVTVLVLASICCCASLGMAYFFSHPGTTASPAPAYVPPQASVPVQPTTAPEAKLPATWTAASCDELAKTLGLKLTALKEGGFYACVYAGPVVPINIPGGIIADVDRGGIKVAVGPVYTESNNVTFRRWDGSLEEACAQVQNLTAFGQLQQPKFTASPLNFSCR